MSERARPPRPNKTTAYPKFLRVGRHELGISVEDLKLARLPRACAAAFVRAHAVRHVFQACGPLRGAELRSARELLELKTSELATLFGLDDRAYAALEARTGRELPRDVRLGVLVLARRLLTAYTIAHADVPAPFFTGLHRVGSAATDTFQLDMSDAGA